MKKYGNLLFWTIMAVVIVYGAYFFYIQNKPSKLNSAETPSKTTDTNKSTTAPEIILKDLNGQTIKLSDFEGKVVFLNFWASWCPSCREEMAELNQAGKDIAGKNAVLLTVNLTDGVRETPEKVKAYIKDNRFSINVLLDTDGKAANDYGITNIPTTFIINKQGEIYDYIIGPTSEAELLNYLHKLE